MHLRLLQTRFAMMFRHEQRIKIGREVFISYVLGQIVKRWTKNSDCLYQH